jgi:hypothetical protein
MFRVHRILFRRLRARGGAGLHAVYGIFKLQSRVNSSWGCQTAGSPHKAPIPFPAPEDLTGRSVGWFVIRSKLAAGGMGEVYYADTFIWAEAEPLE